MKFNSPILRTFLLLVLMQIEANAQVWDTLSTGVFTDFKDIQFVNKDTGYAVGSKGGIVKTINAGQAWVLQNSTITNTIRGVFFISQAYGFACADSGRIIRTTNGGQTWVLQSSGTTSNLIDVHFVSAKQGLVVGTGKVLFTNDSGNTWQSRTVPLLGSLTLRSVTYTTPSTAWICGDPRSGAQGILYHSVDSGKSWSSYTNTGAPNGKGFNKVLFSSVFNGWLFGQTGVIVHTSDSGQSGWPAQTSGTSFDFLGADYIAGNLYAVGRSGLVAFSSNGGANWSGQYSATTRQLWGVDFVNDSTGWACGDSGVVIKFKKITQTKPIMLLQPNGGEVWQIGKKYNILWYAPGISNLQIDYSLNNGQSWTILANNVNASTGSYAWNLNTVPSVNCLVRLRNSSNLSMGDTSDATFISINTPVGLDYAVQLSATVQTSPPRIQLNWVNDANAIAYTVYRKLKSDTVWTQLASYAGNVLTHPDSFVSVGAVYEYKVTKTTPLLSGVGYLFTGIAIPAVENRGTALLLIDSTFSTYLSAELQQLETDLIGDGWKVIRKSFLPTVKDTAVKNFIKQNYITSNVKSVLLIGQIPVPYSGNFAPDGHAERVGAQPCDAYYADVDGNWTDNSTQTTNNGTIYTPNTPGDGNWDQSTIPSDVELQVGRIDMRKLPIFSLSEKDLIKHYLNKNHRFRHKLLTASNSGLLFTRADIGIPNISAAGWRSQTSLFGAANLRDISTCTNSSCTNLIDSLKTNSYLWTYAGDGGSDTSFGGNTFTSTYCAQDSIKSVFMQVWGSYFVEWNKGSSYLQNNLLRSIIANKSHTLVSVWAGRFPYWYFHPMAMGESVGACAILNQNNTRGVYEGGQPSLLAGAHMAIMGDPTLRLHIIAPISVLAAQSVANKIQLSWTTSPDATSGYYIYRSNSMNGTFTRIGSVSASSMVFTDSFPIAGNNVYMIRPLRLEISPSGSYFNLGQGCFDTITFNYSTPVFNLTASAGSGGTISPSGVVVAAQGANKSFVIKPDAGYHIDSLIVDGSSVSSDTLFMFSNIQGNHSIRVVFAINSYTIMATAGNNGTISPSGSIAINHNQSQAFSFFPSNGYMIDSVWVDQNFIGSPSSYTFTQVQSNHSILVKFKQSPMPTFIIMASAGTGGTISPSGSVVVNQNDSSHFIITPDISHFTDSVIVDGIHVGALSDYTFYNVSSTHTIRAVFRAKPNGLTPIAFSIWELFPNPASKLLYLKNTLPDGPVELVNSTGAVVMRNDQLLVEGDLYYWKIEHLPAGLYSLVRFGNKNAELRKVIIVH